MLRRFIFASESVGEGHPDKVCDTISDAVLDACLRQDRRSRVACETYAKSNVVIVGGEITIPNLPKGAHLEDVIPIIQIVRETVRDIGYIHDDDVFHARKIFINTVITDQSHDISQGVDAKKAKGKQTSEQGAGDQGLMFGFACDDTPELMPAPIMFAHRLGRELTRIRKSGKAEWLRPDAKSQVSVIYDNGKPVGISNVVISTQHTEEISHDEIKKFCIAKIIRKVLPKSMVNGTTQFLINPTGRFVIGGPQGDTGLTGRKIIVDSYGGWGRHGGGAFSGKNVVASGLATRCEIQFAYAIGYPDPVSMNINTFGTNTVPEEAIERAVNRTFSFKPAEIIQQLDLLRPIYSKTTNYGHFGKDDPDITWEKTDKANALRKAAR
jgi:S-adenosylmethionine synthetase